MMKSHSAARQESLQNQLKNSPQPHRSGSTLRSGGKLRLEEEKIRGSPVRGRKSTPNTDKIDRKSFDPSLMETTTSDKAAYLRRKYFQFDGDDASKASVGSNRPGRRASPQLPPTLLPNSPLPFSSQQIAAVGELSSPAAVTWGFETRHNANPEDSSVSGTTDSYSVDAILAGAGAGALD